MISEFLFERGKKKCRKYKEYRKKKRKDAREEGENKD